jgi:hypothetical protein
MIWMIREGIRSLAMAPVCAGIGGTVNERLKTESSQIFPAG